MSRFSIVHWFPWRKKDKPLAPGVYDVVIEDMFVLPHIDGGEVAVVELKVEGEHANLRTKRDGDPSTHR